MYQRGPEIKDYSIKYVFVFKSKFLSLFMQFPKTRSAVLEANIAQKGT